MPRQVTFAFILLLLLACSAVAQPCQDQVNKINFGRRWQSWSEGMRLLYIDAFRDGQSETYLAFDESLHLPAEPRERLRKALFLFYDSDVLGPVMTDLYKAPANTFISLSAMIYIARDKLSGEDVEPNLRYARQRKCEFTR